MKKIITFVSCLTIAATFQGNAQSQRLVLVEEFTNASCGPCASQNPTFNTLLGNNLTKAISIKYQTNWPGYDPMNVQTQTDVASRVSYYGVNGVPYSPIDGDTTVAPVGGYYYGAPHNIVQSTIDSKYAIASPFDIIMSHSFSADYDSVFITMNITNTLATSSTFLMARIGLVEKAIVFPVAPGTNGEKEFYYVMRKMYPNPSGTPVTATGLGQTQTITIAAPVPQYTYDFNQLAVVGFIQDDADWTIQQAGFSDAQPVADMVGIKSMTGVQTVQCSANYTPVLTLKNFGTTQLTSCNVNYKFDNNPITTLPITCNIAPGLISNVTLPQITSSAGAHDLYVNVSNPNNSSYNSEFLFNTINKKAIVATNFHPVPVTEGFEGATFPAPEWYIDNPDNGPTWARKAGAGASGNACAKIDIFSTSNVNGQFDDLYTPAIDLTNAVSPVSLDFAVASARRTTTSGQKLDVRLSYNCGTSWINVYSKSGATLATTTTLLNTSAFTPTASQWRTESIDLDAYIGQPNILVQFRATKNGGNNIYIDDVNFYDGSLKVNNVDRNSSFFSAYQVSESFVNVKLNLEEADAITFEVYDILGKKIYSEDKGKLSAGDQTFAYNIDDISSGVYILKLTAGSKVFNQKIKLNK